MGFSRLIKNFSSKECRFDSKTEPWFRLFQLLPIAISTLKALAESADDHARPAAELLRQFGGSDGYCRLVSAAVVADGMLVLGKYVNLNQALALATQSCAVQVSDN